MSCKFIAKWRSTFSVVLVFTENLASVSPEVIEYVTFNTIISSKYFKFSVTELGTRLLEELGEDDPLLFGPALGEWRRYKQIIKKEYLDW